MPGSPKNGLKEEPGVEDECEYAANRVLSASTLLLLLFFSLATSVETVWETNPFNNTHSAWLRA